MMTEIKDFLHQQWVEIKEDKYSMALLVVVLVGGLGMGIWKGKNWYVARKEGAAQLVFAQAYDEYQGALNASLKKEDAGKIEQAFKDAAISLQSVQDEHGSSVYGTYSQALQADLLVHEKNYKGAQELLEAVIKRMGKNSPAYYLYQTKLALVSFDAGDAQKGITLLEQLAADESNQQSDTAAFYLGSYYWAQKQYDKAKKAWAVFEKPFDEKDPKKNSPWMQIVAAKLAQLS